MKTEKIIAAWTSAALMFINCLPQIKHEGVKMAIICVMVIFTLFIFGWSICNRKKSNDNPESR
jgi:hypothetical protein